MNGGGVYLDTDVMVNKSFSELLSNHSFIGYTTDNILSTAVIGAEPRNPIIAKMLEMYESGNFESKGTVYLGEEYANFYLEDKWIGNNDCLTWCLIKIHPELSLNNKTQDFGDITVYPNSFFDIGDVWNRCYSRHLGTALWNSGSLSLQRSITDGDLKMAIKSFLLKNLRLWSMVRMLKFKLDKRKKSTFKISKLQK